MTELARLLRSWRWREARETDLCDPDEVAATELDQQIHHALCGLDADFFEALARATRELKKPKRIPHVESLRALDKAYRRLLSRNGNKEPTWHEVVELATSEFGMVEHTASTLKRMRKELGATYLPNRPGGRGKK